MKILPAALLCIFAAPLGTAYEIGVAPYQAPGVSSDNATGDRVLSARSQERRRPVPELDLNVRTGPDLGARIPEFEGLDQKNRKRNFESLRGPKGLLLLFYRSADW